jgi:hypothetical protein
LEVKLLFTGAGDDSPLVDVFVTEPGEEPPGSELGGGDGGSMDAAPGAGCDLGLGGGGLRGAFGGGGGGGIGCGGAGGGGAKFAVNA